MGVVTSGEKLRRAGLKTGPYGKQDCFHHAWQGRILTNGVPDPLVTSFGQSGLHTHQISNSLLVKHIYCRHIYSCVLVHVSITLLLEEF